jgi:hypothetical protein
VIVLLRASPRRRILSLAPGDVTHSSPRAESLPTSKQANRSKHKAQPGSTHRRIPRLGGVCRRPLTFGLRQQELSAVVIVDRVVRHGCGGLDRPPADDRIGSPKARELIILERQRRRGGERIPRARLLVIRCSHGSQGAGASVGPITRVGGRRRTLGPDPLEFVPLRRELSLVVWIISVPPARIDAAWDRSTPWGGRCTAIGDPAGSTRRLAQ